MDGEGYGKASPLRFSVSRLPVNAAARDDAGLPLGVVAQPFGPLGGGLLLGLAADELQRCADCGAYLCDRCPLQRDGWVCALCGAQCASLSCAAPAYPSPVSPPPALPARARRALRRLRRPVRPPIPPVRAAGAA